MPEPPVNGTSRQRAFNHRCQPLVGFVRRAGNGVCLYGAPLE